MGVPRVSFDGFHRHKISQNVIEDKSSPSLLLSLARGAVDLGSGACSTGFGVLAPAHAGGVLGSFRADLEAAEPMLLCCVYSLSYTDEMRD